MGVTGREELETESIMKWFDTRCGAGYLGTEIRDFLPRT